MAEQFSGPLGELLASLVPRVAAKVHRDYQLIPADDLEQEMWLRVLGNPVKFEKLCADNNEGAIYSELRRAGRRACKEDERFRRAAKAAAAGYDIDDEQFYSAGLLRQLLPIYLDGGVAEDPPRYGDNGGGGSSKAANESTGNFLALMIDLDRGMAALKPGQRKLLIDFFAVPQEDDHNGRWQRQQLASSMGLTLHALEERVRRAVQALQHHLGGENPWRRLGLQYPPVDAGNGRTPTQYVDPDSGVRGMPTRSQREALRRRG